MSHMPFAGTTTPDAADIRTTNSFRPWSVYAARVDMKKKHFALATTADFVNPSLGDSVTINVAPFPLSDIPSVGDFITVGALVGYYRTGTVVSNPVTFTAYRKGLYPTATVINAVQRSFVISSGGITQLSTNFSVPETYNNSSTTASVDSLAAVPSNSIVAISTFAGVFQITSVPLSYTQVVAVKVSNGDVPAGQTIESGAPTASGYLLGITRNNASPDFAGSQWVPYDMWIGAVTGAVSGAAPVVGLGWGGDVAAGIGIYGQFLDAAPIPNPASGTTMLATGTYREVAIRSQNGERLAIPRGHPLMLAITTPATGVAANYITQVFVRGYYTS